MQLLADFGLDCVGAISLLLFIWALFELMVYKKLMSAGNFVSG
jgi:hypothetical protein